MRLPAAAEGLRSLRGRAHWERCGFVTTALADELVTLAPDPAGERLHADPTPFAGGFAGLAFDTACRLFHALPQDGAVEFLLWGRQSGLRVPADRAQRYALSGAESETGEFGSDAPLPRRPLALAALDTGYLCIADPDTPALWLVDIAQHEVARRIELAARPLDAAAHGGAVFVLTDAPGWLRLAPCEAPQPLAWPAALGPAGRLDLTPEGRGFVLTDPGAAAARLVCLDDLGIFLEMPFCTDFAIAADGSPDGPVFVLARRPGEDFARRRLAGRRFRPLAGLRAAGYDGRGIALAPDGRIAYWSERGLRHAAPAPQRYALFGRVFGCALDSEHFQMRWGRLLVEACIPEGTKIEIRCFARDEFEPGGGLARSAPAGEALAAIALADDTPLVAQVDWAHRPATAQTLVRDPSLRPLEAPAADGFARYEAPVMAAPGRYLWLVIELTGSRSRSPRLRAIDVQYPGHDLLKHLPRTLYREPPAREFLQRWLAPLAAMLGEWGGLAGERQRLLDPRSAPEAALPWLASLVGLAFEPCWGEAPRRRVLAEAARLFRRRGTVAGLARMIELFTGARVIIVEKFRLRGGGVIGEATESRAVLGGGWRVGGAIGTPEDSPLADRAVESAAAFASHAHRFSAIVVATLDAGQLDCLRRLVETHRPAHTLFDLCTAETGVRVGVGLHVGLAAVVGRGAGFDASIVGDAVLGKGYLLGRPELDRPAASGDCP